MSVTGVVGGRGKQQVVKSTVGETEPRRKGWSFELERNASPGGNTHGMACSGDSSESWPT